MASHAKHAVHITHNRTGDAVGGTTSSGGANPLAIVVSVTVAAAGFVPSSTTVEGETVHVIELAGAPGQAQVTVPINPETGVAEIVKLVCCPAASVALVGEAETL